jgi:hypothetical protein
MTKPTSKIFMVSTRTFSLPSLPAWCNNHLSRDDAGSGHDNHKPKSDVVGHGNLASPTTNSAQESGGNPQVTAEDDGTNENVAHAMKLLLAARERVLTLSEQRVRSLANPPTFIAYVSLSLFLRF